MTEERPAACVLLPARDDPRAAAMHAAHGIIVAPGRRPGRPVHRMRVRGTAVP